MAESMPEKDLEDLIVRMWNRLDRDMSGTITKEELNCEEFHNMVLAAVAPVTKSGGGGGALYSRSQLNMAEAIAFCLRKADQNDDGNLSFAEFRSLVKTLQDVHVQPSSAHLAFSLFDLDYSLTIDKMEFKEVMRFFMGHNPTEVEYREEWARLSSRSRGDKVTRDDYIRWLQTTPNPVFHQHAPPVQSEGEKGESKSLADLSRSHSSGLREKARWNKRFNACMNPLHVNDFRPQALREYFSTSQSVPELRSFYDTYPDAFKKHRARMDAPSSPEATCALWPKSVSTEGGTPLLLPKRHTGLRGLGAPRAPLHADSSQAGRTRPKRPPETGECQRRKPEFTEPTPRWHSESAREQQGLLSSPPACCTNSQFAPEAVAFQRRRLVL